MLCDYGFRLVLNRAVPALLTFIFSVTAWAPATYADDRQLTAELRADLFFAVSPRGKIVTCLKRGNIDAQAGAIIYRETLPFFKVFADKRMKAWSGERRYQVAQARQSSFNRLCQMFRELNDHTLPEQVDSLTPYIIASDTVELPGGFGKAVPVSIMGMHLNASTKVYLLATDERVARPMTELTIKSRTTKQLEVDLPVDQIGDLSLVAMNKIGRKRSYSNVATVKIRQAADVGAGEGKPFDELFTGDSDIPSSKGGTVDHGSVATAIVAVASSQLPPPTRRGEDGGVTWIPYSSLNVPPGAPLTIPAGTNILADIDINAGNITISGTLKVPNGANRNITATNIYVLAGGTFQVGESLEDPILEQVVITLTAPMGNRTPRTTGYYVDAGYTCDDTRTLHVMDGNLYMFGAARTTTWTMAKLNENAAAGSTTLVFDRPLYWPAGARFALAPTGFPSPTNQVEILTVAYATNGSNVVHTTSGIQSSRWGRMQYPLSAPVSGIAVSLTPSSFSPPGGDGPISIDERAEAGLITRNIVLQGANDAAWSNNRYGGHVMVMGLGSSTLVDGVEFRRMGQGACMARYPIHWHMLSRSASDPITGVGGGTFLGRPALGSQIVMYSSFGDTGNRAVTVHASEHIIVANNVAARVPGHVFYLEDGTEMHNYLIGNLGMGARDPGPGYRMRVNDAQASAYWITNPLNVLYENTAADSAGPGHWWALANSPRGLSHNAPGINPSTTPLGLHERNVSHSNYGPGFQTAFGPSDESGNVLEWRYDPATPFTVNELDSWNNLGGGYQNRVGKGVYSKFKMHSNNGRDLSGQAMDVRLRKSLFVAQTLNSFNTTPNLPYRIGHATYHDSLIDEQGTTYIGYHHTPPMQAENGISRFAGGAISYEDNYASYGDEGLLMDHRLIDSDPGYISPQPYFDGQPIVIPGNTTATNMRHWSFPVRKDFYGEYGPVGNTVTPNDPFFTFGSPFQVLQPTSRQGVSIPRRFYSLLDFVFGVQNVGMGWWEATPPPLIVRRLDPSTLLEVGRAEVGSPAQAAFFPGYRTEPLAQSLPNQKAIYDVSFPGQTLETGYIRFSLANASLPSDSVVICLANNMPAGPLYIRLDSGNGPFSQNWRQITGTMRMVPNMGASFSTMVNDNTGQTYYRDYANNRVCLQYVGGVPLPSTYGIPVSPNNPTNENAELIARRMYVHIKFGGAPLP